MVAVLLGIEKEVLILSVGPLRMQQILDSNYEGVSLLSAFAGELTPYRFRLTFVEGKIEIGNRRIIS